uniref:Ubiquitin-like protease family profile domain-containing protein n=1 Tax=Oryza meridionalis TaxID=40149 RepID=A0A0E0EQG2_9ORYZ
MGQEYQTMPSSAHDMRYSGLSNGGDKEQLPSQESEVPLTTKIVVKPNEELKSPFLVKRHLFLKRPDPSILDELYDSIIGSSRQVWVPNEIEALVQEAVKPEGLMDTFCLNLAVRNMATEDAEKFKNTKCLGWRHYVDSNWKKSINDPNNLRNEYSRLSTMYDPSGSHLVLIPVSSDGHWTLYAFNMHDKKLCILDSRRDTSEGGDQDPEKRHEKIRKEVCHALNETMDVDFTFLSWKHEFPKVPRQQNSYDCGFFVFNFMRLWDGRRLIRWFSTETKELRKNFLAYILSSSDDHSSMPTNVSELIKKLPGETMMNVELLEAARAGNANAFCELVIDPARSINHQPSRSASCSCLLFRSTSIGSYCLCFECTSSRNSDQENNPNKHSALTRSDAPSTVTRDTRDMLHAIQGVTVEGDGVLHIAASFGVLEPVQTVLEAQNGAFAAVLLQAENNKGDRPLHSAATTGSIVTVKFIVDKARRIMQESDTFVWFLRAKNLDGQTCLHEAVRHGHKDVVEYLVSKDADLGVPSRSRDVPLPLVQIVDNEGTSPLYLATTLRRDSIVKVLTEAAPSGMPRAASYSGPAGKTALHAAVLFSEELSRTLVNWNHSLIKIRDESGSTPLHYLADGKYTTEPSCISVTKLLLQKDPSSGYCEDSEGSLPIHIAAANGTLGIIDQLIKLCPGCESSCNASGQTILHIAVQTESHDVVRFVCLNEMFKMVLNMKDNDGNTALHLAVQKGHNKTFGILMGCKNVSLSIRNRNGYTPLDHAVLNKTSGLTYATYWPGHQRWVCNSLLAAGADFGTFRADHLSSKIPEQAKADREAFSDTLSKSAAVMATCAALLFNAALNIFLNVQAIYHNNNTSSNNSNATQGSDQLKLIQKVKKLSGDSLSISACAILLFAIAGFPILPGVIGRTFALILGLGVLIGSSMISLQALAARLDLAKVYGTGIGAFCIIFSLLCVTLCTNLLRKIVQHARPLWARCGAHGFFRSILNVRRAQNYSAIPLLQVCALIEVLLLTCLVMSSSIEIVTKNFPISLQLVRR